MTREEAIKYLIKPVATSTEIGEEKLKEFEAYNMAIEALQAEYEDYEHATLVDIKEPLKVLVVRCKDCRHWNSETKGCKRNPSVEAWYEDDFCKYGKRWSNAID